MLVGQILKAKQITKTIYVSPTAALSQAAELLSEHRIGAIIVAEDPQKPLGILSERDIVRELGRAGSGCLSEAVSHYMTSKLVTCATGTTALQALEAMSQGRFRHMPVMEGDKMIGVISIGDVVQARLQQLAQENDAMESMIAGV